MAKTAHAHFTTIEELEQFEKIDSRVSDKYVPILTTDIIDILEPEFNFVYGEKYYNFNSAHTVFLKSKDETHIAIGNSFDRTRAFSAFLVQDQIRIPLDLDRQIHLGSEAAHLVENFEENKPEFFEAIKHAKNVVQKFKDTEIPDSIKEEILDIVFAKVKERKLFIELDVQISTNYSSFFTYINEAINRYLTGQYNVVLSSKTNKDGEVIRKGSKTSSRFIKLQITNAIYEYLSTEHIEIML